MKHINPHKKFLERFMVVREQFYDTRRCEFNYCFTVYANYAICTTYDLALKGRQKNLHTSIVQFHAFCFGCISFNSMRHLFVRLLNRTSYSLSRTLCNVTIYLLDIKTP